MKAGVCLMMHVSGIPFFLDAFNHLDTNVFYLIVHMHSNKHTARYQELSLILTPPTGVNVIITSPPTCSESSQGHLMAYL